MAGLLVVYLYKSSVYNSHVARKYEENGDVVDPPDGSSSALDEKIKQKLVAEKKDRIVVNRIFHQPVAETIDPCGGARKNASSTEGGGNGNGIVGESVYQHWRYIDETIQREYPGERVSGGIFLYPRQSAILTHLVRKVHEGLLRDGGGDRDDPTLTICETGFGSGHSMALFQEASKSLGPVRIVSFDKFDRPYQLPIWHHFNRTAAEATTATTTNQQGQPRHEHFAGNSCKTVPRELPSANCDFLHGSSLCPTDNIDLVEHSPCGILLTSTAMGSLGDRAVYFGERAQWRKLRDRGCITGITCYREDGAVPLERDYIFAKKGDKRTDEFCVAVTTGRCQRGSLESRAVSAACRNRVDAVLRDLALGGVCPAHRIPAPA